MIAIFIHGFLILALCFLNRPKERSIVFWGGLAFRITLGICLGLYYFIYVGYGDTLVFHKQALRLYEIFQSSFSDYFKQLFNSNHHLFQAEYRNELFVKIISIFYCISGGSYWVASLYLTFLSFLGAWFLVKSLTKLNDSYFWPASIAFIFFPSVAFWSSGVLKDALINGALFYVAGICIRFQLQKKFKWEYLLTFVSLTILLDLKHYLMAMVFLVMMALIWRQVLKSIDLSGGKKWSLTILTFIGLIFIASLVNPRLHLDQLPTTIYNNYETVLEHSDKNTLKFTHLSPDWISLLIYVPASLYAGLFRPFLSEAPTPYIPFASENLIVFLLVIINIRYGKFIKISYLGWVTLGYIIVLATFLPLVSPNFGSLWRYKAAYAPFLLFILSITPYQRLIMKRKNV